MSIFAEVQYENVQQNIISDMIKPIAIYISVVVMCLVMPSCASRPDSPYYIDKSEASNRYATKVVKQFNNLAADYTNLVNEPSKSVSKMKILGYERNIKNFASSTKSAVEKGKIGLGLAKSIGKKTVEVGKDFVGKFKDVLPVNPDWYDIGKKMLDLLK